MLPVSPITDDTLLIRPRPRSTMLTRSLGDEEGPGSLAEITGNQSWPHVFRGSPVDGDASVIHQDVEPAKLLNNVVHHTPGLSADDVAFVQSEALIRVITRVAGGVEGDSPDLRDGDVRCGGKYRHDLVARPVAAPCLLFEADIEGLELLVALQGGTEGAAPHDVIGEGPVGDAGIVLLPACLQFLDEVGHRLVRSPAWLAPKEGGAVRVRRDCPERRASAGLGGPDQCSS
jgi:hypothetical protein